MADSNMPTPKTLDEAILQALMVGPLNQIRERAYLVMKDFLAQRFGVAMLKEADPRVVSLLEDLFEEIVKRGPDAKV